MKLESVCTYCGVGCDIVAEIEDNKITKITANKNSIITDGKLCIKGYYGYDFTNSSNRLKKVKIKELFIKKNFSILSESLQKEFNSLDSIDGYYYPSLESAYEVVAIKYTQIIKNYGSNSISSIGGARTSCESSYLFQKFTREVVGSPNVDSCARICHAPSLRGMRSVIGEGAATNPFEDISKCEFIMIIGSNTTEAHPVVANRVIKAIKNGVNLALFEVRDIVMSKFAKYSAITPYESNLLVFNMLSFVIISEKLYDKEFIDNRTKGWLKYKKSILNDPLANPDFFQKIIGYEYLSSMIKEIAREYASKKSLILWGLGVTEHNFGSYSIMAIANLAVMTGNIGKTGAGLIPLRGQNNVQGVCDMGMLPYYTPDYTKPKEEGLKTPDLINEMLEDKIKILFNMGEDLAHVHPNQNKIHKALKKVNMIVVNELFDNETTKYGDVIFGVKSAYEKTGVYVNAERRLHLSQPLVTNELPDDWEVVANIGKLLDEKFCYNTSEEIWQEVTKTLTNRYEGASYKKLKKNRVNGLQWPVKQSDTPTLHIDKFRTSDGLATFRYKQYEIRGMIKELLEKQSVNDFYLTTGRVLSQYNNSAQTIRSKKLLKKQSEDIVLVSKEDKKFFENRDRVVLVSKYGESSPLKFKISEKIRKGTAYVSFHFAKSRVNFLFGDESDSFTKTANFKSLKVKVK